MMGCLYMALVFVLIPVEGKHYLYRSRYNWKPKWAEPTTEYKDTPVPPPFPGEGVAPCPAQPEPPVTVTTVTTTTTTTPTTTTSTAVLSSSAGPTTEPATTSDLRDCIADGGGICTASCNIGTFTLEDSSFSCEGNGIGSVCCLEP